MERGSEKSQGQSLEVRSNGKRWGSGAGAGSAMEEKNRDRACHALRREWCRLVFDPKGSAELWRTWSDFPCAVSDCFME